MSHSSLNQQGVDFSVIALHHFSQVFYIMFANKVIQGEFRENAASAGQLRSSQDL